ncbi:MAG: SDR family oxidoreductase [Candidatus Coatesbacteria bacterium]|nr:SDR family oxidoreductase [Candidatus Coatesbacteria bacterium]
MHLIGKTAVVTGGGTGIGKAIALRLAQEGANVAICGRRKGPLEETLSVLPGCGSKHFAIAADVSRKADVDRFVRSVIERFGSLDILVNNAGILFRKNIMDTCEEDWDSMFDINVKGIYLFSKAVLPHMIQQKSGNILNIGSVSGLRAASFADAYCASKAAVHMLTRSLAKGYAQHGIRVNCICPAHVDTPIMDLTIEFFNSIGVESDRAKIDSLYPLGRRGMPNDVASLALFLVSDQSAWMTGALVVLDGGVTA